MKLLSKKISITLLAILLSVPIIYAQKHEMGIHAIAGATELFSNSRPSSFVSPFSKNPDPIYGVGLSYQYNFKVGYFSLISGLNYENKAFGTYGSALYLRVPLGIELNTPNKLFASISPGVNFNFLLNKNELNRFENFFSGVYFNLGIGYRFSSDISVVLKYQMNWSISSAYKEDHTSPGGLNYNIYNHWIDAFFSLGLKYKFGKN